MIGQATAPGGSLDGTAGISRGRRCGRWIDKVVVDIARLDAVRVGDRDVERLLDRVRDPAPGRRQRRGCPSVEVDVRPASRSMTSTDLPDVAPERRLVNAILIACVLKTANQSISSEGSPPQARTRRRYCPIGSPKNEYTGPSRAESRQCR